MTLALPYLSRPTTINKRIQIEKKKKTKLCKLISVKVFLKKNYKSENRQCKK